MVVTLGKTFSDIWWFLKLFAEMSDSTRTTIVVK